MNELIGRVFSFGKDVFHHQSELYAKLSEGQSPKALIISCADSRVVPEHIVQAAPGDLFVCRNAGNIVPPYGNQNGGVTSTVEYAVMVLGVTDIVVCGHSDCGAMKAFLHPEALEKMPNVAAWLRHSHAAHSVVCNAYPDLAPDAYVRAMALENVVVQINHLRTHPCVASAIAEGKLTLHGWLFDIETTSILALDGATGRFAKPKGPVLPVAVAAGRRVASEQAAE